MIFQYEKPVKDDITLQDQIFTAVKEFKEMKRTIIRQAIEAMTGRPYDWEEVKDRVKYTTYTTTNHVFYYEDKPVLKFSPSDVITKDNLIICKLEYVKLYRKAGA